MLRILFDMKIFRGAAILLFVGALVSCDAPRLNPLDPQNPDYQLSTIEGVIQTTALPKQPIQGVKVYWKNENLISFTDAQGKFLIDRLPQKQGWIYFEKDNYSTDSVNINLLNQKTVHVEISLNAIPKLEDYIIYTSVLNRYPDAQSDSLFVKAKISDAENDLSSVYVRCADLSIDKKLTLNSSSGYYENKFAPSDLNMKSVDEGIGKNFDISVYNAAGKEFKIGSSTIKRTIRQDIVFRSPANLETVTKPVKFSWGRFIPGYNFTYTLEIYTNANAPDRKIHVTGISKDAIEITTNSTDFNINNLPAGEYFWVIWVIDDFQNRVRSRPASFVIQ